MKKLKSDDDRVSELPDSVIFLIFSFMDMRDVVKTTLLSKRWKNLWRTTPYLNFDVKVVERYVSNYSRNPADSRAFINGALLLWAGSEILKFKVSWSSSQSQQQQLYRELHAWLRFATWKNVQELELKFDPCAVHVIAIQSFQSCPSLQKLSVINCDLVVRGAVQWRRLKCLTLSTVSAVSQDLIDRVFSGSPQLENFDLQVIKGSHGDLSIQSSSLKRLSLRSRAHVPSTSAGLLQICICAPKLKALVIQGASLRNCLLVNVPSLSRVNLDLTLSNNKAVKLSPDGLKMMLGEGISSLNAKVLRVRAAPCQLVLDLLKHFPKLEMLAIDFKFNLSEADDILFEFMPLFMQLTAVEITWCKYGPSMFRVIECLLKHAPILAKMVIKNGMVVRAEDASLVAQKLLSLQRSFQAVSLNILHQNFS